MRTFAPISDVLHLQRLLAFFGIDPGPLDGIWGEMTSRAVDHLSQVTARLREQQGGLDPRSETCIAFLHPKLQQGTRELIRAAHEIGLQARVVSGLRTYAEQEQLFRQGRFGDPRPRVTNARPGQSLHNFGLAFDVGLFEGGRYLGGPESYERLGQRANARSKELEWGGNWSSFRDLPHYQLRLPQTLRQLRAGFERGRPLFSQASAAQGKARGSGNGCDN